jgi:hypothetical protein
MRVFVAMLASCLVNSASADSVYTTITSHLPDFSVPIESIALEYNSFLGTPIYVTWDTPVGLGDIGQTWTLDRNTVANDGHPWWNRLNDLLTNGVYDSNLTFYFCGDNSCGGYGLPGNDIWSDGDHFAYLIDSNFTPTEVDMKGHHLTRMEVRLDTLTAADPYMAEVTLTVYGEPGEVPEPISISLAACVAPFMLLRRRHHTPHPLRK